MNERVAFQAEPFEFYETASSTWPSPLAAVPLVGHLSYLWPFLRREQWLYLWQMTH
jgi:hypothetical protein